VTVSTSYVICCNQNFRYCAIKKKFCSKAVISHNKYIVFQKEHYKLSIIQHFRDADKVVRKEFCMQAFHKMFHIRELLRSMWQEIDYRSAALPVKVTLSHNKPW
jgi:hypothetical protein